MAKALSKSQVVAAIAQENDITREQASRILDSIACLAYQEAKNNFTLPGIGKLGLVSRPARSMVMRFGADKGKTKTIPAKSVVKFRVAKAARDAILSGNSPRF
jgi:DNA-binding protein HU-beta